MYYIFSLLTLTLVQFSRSETNDISIKQFVDDINSNQSLWTAKVNPLNEDVKLKLGFLGLHPDPNFQPKIKSFKIGKSVIPETFDARRQWPHCADVIGNIRNQGACGSCWSNGKIKVEFSPEDLLCCCKPDERGCDGGYPVEAFAYFINKGVVSGGDFGTYRGCKPYTAYFSGITPECTHICQSTYNTTYDKDKHYGITTYQLQPIVEQIQMEIMTSGPVVVGFTVYEDFQYYSQGIYYYVSGVKTGDHAVKIIEWGKENKIAYWLAANSWDKDWASYGGLFKIRRGTNECGIESQVVAGNPYTGEGPPPKPKPGSSVKVGSSSIGVGLTLMFFYLFRF